MTTANAVRTIRSRNGKPPSAASGSASAAASVMTPRMPDQETTSAPRTVGG